MSQPFLVKPDSKISLKHYDPEDTGTYKRRSEVEERLQALQEQMTELQELLYAEGKHALLIVLQAMDTGGKDGTIRRVMSGINPQGCDVVSFKAPSAEELSRDFLWRAHKAVPPKGKIIIFNRSHYEDVLVVRVHNLVPKAMWAQRYEQINHFEELLVENGTVVLKFFLHISKAEQKQRIQDRLDDPSKHWKISEADIRERAYWDDYMEAFEAVFNRCSTEWAPWYIIPANTKWYRDVAIAEIIVERLKALDMKYPQPKIDISKIKIDD